MKKLKIFISVLIMNLLFITSNAQIVEKSKSYGPICNCGVGQSSCSTTCVFSDCCICWNPNTQSGGCGCYYGIATCKNEKINSKKGIATDENIFGDVNPDSEITFHFNNFKKLIPYFEKIEINVLEFQNTLNEVSIKYNKTDDNTKISNEDFNILLKAYSKLIFQLNDIQKNDLNMFIKSI